MKSSLIYAFIFVVFCCSPLEARVNEEEFKRAGGLIKIEQIPEAAEIVNDQIKNDPENAEVLFRGAKLYQEMGEIIDAVKHYIFAAKADEKGYKEIASSSIQSIAFSMAEAGKYSLAKEVFTRNYEIAPELREKDIESLLSIGKKLLNQSDEYSADSYFNIAKILDVSVRNDIADIYFDSGNRKNNPNFDFLQKSIEHSPSTKQRVIDAMLMLSEQAGQESDKNEARRRLKKLVSNTEYDRYFPPLPRDVVHYTVGPHYIYLKAGETLNHIISPPLGKSYKISISSDDDNFYLVISEDEKYLIKNTKSLPDGKIIKFTLTAVSDQKIKLVISE